MKERYITSYRGATEGNISFRDSRGNRVTSKNPNGNLKTAGGLSPSAVTHQYKRILRRLREDSRFSKGWEKESKSIMSMIKGRPP